MLIMFCDFAAYCLLKLKKQYQKYPQLRWTNININILYVVKDYISLKY